MQELTLIQRMMEFKPIPWTMIPDLGLYMDQVTTYIERHLETLHGERAKGMITPSMINNYVKTGLLPRPLGKKYYREHLALLMMVVMLKPVASMDGIARLIAPKENQSVAELYEEFCRTQLQVIRTISIDPEATALQHAVTAAAYQLVSELFISDPE